MKCRPSGRNCGNACAACPVSSRVMATGSLPVASTLKRGPTAGVNTMVPSRLLRRIVAQLGSRFAQYVVVDGGFATAPFLHTADDVGLKVIARLKSNLPELL